MDTNKVYLGKIYEVESVDEGYFQKNIRLSYTKDALMISKKNIFGKKYMKDLNNGKKYNVELPTRIGALYVSRTYLKSFNAAIDNEIVNMPKKKVLELGNKYIKENKEK